MPLAAGDLEALTAQVDRLSSHLTSLKEDFKGVNSSRIKKLEEQTKTFVTIASVSAQLGSAATLLRAVGGVARLEHIRC